MRVEKNNKCFLEQSVRGGEFGRGGRTPATGGQPSMGAGGRMGATRGGALHTKPSSTAPSSQNSVPHENDFCPPHVYSHIRQCSESAQLHTHF